MKKILILCMLLCPSYAFAKAEGYVSIAEEIRLYKAHVAKQKQKQMVVSPQINAQPESPEVDHSSSAAAVEKTIPAKVIVEDTYVEDDDTYTSAYISIAAELRAFKEGSSYAGQKDGSGVSIVIEPEIIHEFNDGDDRITFSPFFRFDKNDSDREHVDIREFVWHHYGDGWNLNAGISKVFWGVTESNHLVDVINQTDTVEGVDGEDKLGQPMLSLGFDKDWGNLVLYALPYFRERTFPGAEGRLRAPLPVDTDNPIYESSMKERHLDAAIRFEKVIGDWDFGISHFSGTSRDPVLKAGLDASGNAALIPHYGLIDQTGIDLQYTTDAWLWKFEGMTRGGQGSRFSAFVGGFEYTFFDMGSTGYDVGLVAEYSRDNRGFNTPTTILDDDLFMGFRYAANNIDDTQVLAGMFVDMNTKFKVYSVESSKRFGNNWKAELEFSFYEDPTNGIENALASEDFMFLRIARYY